VRIAVHLDRALVKAAQFHSSTQNRSVAKQIEHWACIGKISEENPDMSYAVIQDILLGLEDIKTGNVDNYKKAIL
jgi:hypothetical protein